MVSARGSQRAEQPLATRAFNQYCRHHCLWKPQEQLLIAPRFVTQSPRLGTIGGRSGRLDLWGWGGTPSGLRSIPVMTAACRGSGPMSLCYLIDVLTPSTPLAIWQQGQRRPFIFLSCFSRGHASLLATALGSCPRPRLSHDAPGACANLSPHRCWKASMPSAAWSQVRTMARNPRLENAKLPRSSLPWWRRRVVLACNAFAAAQCLYQSGVSLPAWCLSRELLQPPRAMQD